MRIKNRCTENFEDMAKTSGGDAFCQRCQHEVVDLRHTPRKRALAVLAERRRRSSTGRVCARVMADPTGVPVFSPDPPSRFARVAGPLALATSLAACSSSAEVASRGTTPAPSAYIAGPHTVGSSAPASPAARPVHNQNGTAPVPTTVSRVTPEAPTTPPINGAIVLEEEWMGDMVEAY